MQRGIFVLSYKSHYEMKEAEEVQLCSVSHLYAIKM